MIKGVLPQIYLSKDVTYWPSTQPSIKKQVHPVEDIRVSPWRVEFGAIAAPTRSRWVSNNYITRCHRQFELESVSWNSSCSSRQGEPARDRGLAALSDLRLSSPTEWEKKCCYSQRNCCSLFRLQLTSHTQPFRNPFENKVWEVYFSKEVCLFVIIVDYVSAYICIRIVGSRLYNKYIFSVFLTRSFEPSLKRPSVSRWIIHFLFFTQTAPPSSIITVLTNVIKRKKKKKKKKEFVFVIIIIYIMWLV